ncbi:MULTISPECIES: methane monooxygenase regulator MmoB [Methylococcus]|jgi:methane monooxygenase regulatory protein B|uniref:Methane monooxygenase regulatory protein B n=2 Tax=Methylococcus capsulatus TaxID=414 RepID=MMOB_METCA|nr:MmoB/DmpM family protein [Methylococcus capsulatus]P18797.2 RecName: Full=Methane monooxygenase regulatory protein B [Methylococcus capsulatus str. Bath]1CKV_A Chain A, PROTEIN (PROTEIN B) [Escherichia coli]4GAM_D Chain D, Methane monooxygenase regulatory protein B [Methylococcus capsulatus str. Bath]4GAM_I Chain I, Methane monooxygenase regulatory protein B [Methylococcus capsulatus str. Bath]4GAM_N Chain N, Methane monooxygenase regulatory protein B [Methylococcus capsulatus str. Bath]4G
MSVNSNAYDAGIMGLKGKDFADQFFADENQVVHESDTVVLVLKKSDEINTFIEEILLTDYKKNVNPTVNVEDRAGYWWIKANGKIEVDCDEISELLGRQFNVYDFLVDVSSTIGRAYTLGNKFTITSELMGLDRKLEDYHA